MPCSTVPLLNRELDAMPRLATPPLRAARPQARSYRLRPTPAQATLIVLVLGLLWRTVRFALAFPLWGDEAFLALSVITRDLAGLARPLEFGQVAPPGFLWAEWGVTRVFGIGERALRLVPYFAGVTSLVLFWRFCRQVASRRVVLVAVAVLGASFYPVRHANEVKPYAVDLLVALSLTTLGWRVWQEPRREARWALLIAGAAGGVWCSYPAVFPAAAVGVLVGARAWRERAVRPRAHAAVYGTALAVSWAAMVWAFALSQARATAWLADLSTWRGAFPPLAQPWRLPWWLLTIHTGNMLAYPHGGGNFGSTATFLLAALGAWAVWRRPARRPLLWLLLGPLVFALAAASLRRYPYGTSARVMLYMAPAFCLLAAEGVVGVFRCSSRRALRYGPTVVATVLGLVAAGWTAWDLYAPYVRQSDLETYRLIKSWADATRPGDRWIVFDGATPLPQAPDTMISQWVQRVAEFRYDVRRVAPVPVSWQPAPAIIGAAAGGRVWLLVHHHGCARLYPSTQRAAYEAALEQRLGTPVSAGPRFIDGATLVAHVYAHSP